MSGSPAVALALALTGLALAMWELRDGRQGKTSRILAMDSYKLIIAPVI